MILIGQFDSPFVRRVAVALNAYGIAFDHWPWSTFGDAERLGAHNPLRRVPTLLLDNGETLIESAAILDHLDEQAGPERALIADAGPERRAALRLCALATGLCDKMVSLVYERVLHDTPSTAWVERCRTQLHAVLNALERERSSERSPYFFGADPGHADIAAACAIRFLKEAHPAIFAEAAIPALEAHSRACEALEIFSASVQPFIPPA